MSGGSGCVEVAFESDLVFVRNTKSPNGPMLSFTRAEWDAFVGGVRAGDFDD